MTEVQALSVYESLREDGDKAEILVEALSYGIEQENEQATSQEDAQIVSMIDDLSAQAEQLSSLMLSVKKIFLDENSAFSTPSKENRILEVLERTLREQAENDILLVASKSAFDQNDITQYRKLSLYKQRSDDLGVQIRALHNLLYDIRENENEDIKQALINADHMILKTRRKEIDQDLLLSTLGACHHAINQIRQDSDDDRVLRLLSDTISRVPINPLSKDFLPNQEIEDTLLAAKEALLKPR